MSKKVIFNRKIIGSGSYKQILADLKIQKF